MPPWYIEKNIGIQKYKNDPSLSALEIAKVGKWADSGAPHLSTDPGARIVAGSGHRGPTTNLA